MLLKYANETFDIPLYVYMLFIEYLTQTVAFIIGPIDCIGCEPTVPAEAELIQQGKNLEFVTGRELGTMVLAGWAFANSNPENNKQNNILIISLIFVYQIKINFLP